MKQFIKELKGEWSPLKYSLNYKGYWQGRGRYLVRSSVIQLNKEISTVAVQLLSAPMYLIIFVVSIFAGILLYDYVGLESLTYVFETLVGFMISFISVLVAAAIFISTLHRRATNDSLEQDREFLTVLAKHKDDFEEIFKACIDSANNDQKFKLFRAAASCMVLDYSDYPAYKDWHLANLSKLDSIDIESYDQFIKYPYDSAMSTSWGRQFYIREAFEAADQILSGEDRATRRLKSIIREVSIATKNHDQNARGSYYIPVEFVGKRLIRVVLYSLVAVTLLVALNTLKVAQVDLIPAVDLQYLKYLTIVTVVFSIASVLLITRYVFKFLAYLRDSTAYGSSAINSLYIYEPDASMRMNGDG